MHCTEGFVALCHSFILGNQCLMGKAKLVFCKLPRVHEERESIELCKPVYIYCVQCNKIIIMHVRNLHTTTCNLLVNFTTPTHSVPFKFTSKLQVYNFTKFSHICTGYTQCLYAVIHRSMLSLFMYRAVESGAAGAAWAAPLFFH